MRKYRKLWEKFVEGVLFSSSTITSLTVILIIIFLFREGIGLFSSKPVDKGYVFRPQHQQSRKRAQRKTT